MADFINKLSLFAAKLGNQRHLSAIRDGFVTLMPLLIVGSLVTLINNIPIGTGDGQVLKVWLAQIPMLSWVVDVNGSVYWGTFGMLSIFSCMTISYYLAKSYDKDPIATSVISLSAFLSIVPQMAVGEKESMWGFINWVYVNASGLFVAIIISLITTEIFVKLSNSKKLIIKMPEGVPPAVSRSFAALIPGMLSILAISFIAVLFNIIFKNNIFDWVTKTVLGPLSQASGSLVFGVIVVLLTHILWVFGIHGPNILEGVLQPLNVMAIPNNIDVLSGGSGDIIIMNKSFLDAFVYMGGSGTCLGLVIAIFSISKLKQTRAIANLSIAPGLFNINEPVIFGLPIVLNPIMIIPFVLAPLCCLFVAYGATAIGFLPPAQAIIPWTTPPILSGLFVTNWAWQGPVIQIINLALSILIYIPFVKVLDTRQQ